MVIPTIRLHEVLADVIDLHELTSNSTTSTTPQQSSGPRFQNTELEHVDLNFEGMFTI